MKKPPWIRIKVPQEKFMRKMKSLLEEIRPPTVCESAICPNIGSCFSQGTLTFMILGEICTRNCGFCSVTHGIPKAPNILEAEKVAKAALRLNIDHVVVTSVTRDDLSDGGAFLFAETVKQIKALIPKASTELLVPDFGGKEDNLKIVLDAKPDILAHNIETGQFISCQRYFSKHKEGKFMNHNLFIKSHMLFSLN